MGRYPNQYPAPGFYQEEVFPAPTSTLVTGVSVFLGYAAQGPVNTPQRLTLGPQFEALFGAPLTASYLAYAVQGFFENGGSMCYVVRLAEAELAEPALRAGLESLVALENFDLICAPDIMAPRTERLDFIQIRTLQLAVLDYCDQRGTCFAILDAWPGAEVSQVLQQRQGLAGLNGAIYYPEVLIPDGPAWSGGFVPACGHLAGIYARSDQRAGVHKAPANEILEGVLDFKVNLSNAQQSQLNEVGINALRAFPGRGLRVWGARTLSRDPNWMYINVRRLFITVARWVDYYLDDLVFEPNNLRLWVRIQRELTAYFEDLLRQGALKGSTPDAAFYIKCDEETNPSEVREAGKVVTEIGLAPAVPNEFIVVRLIHADSGVTVEGPV